MKTTQYKLLLGLITVLFMTVPQDVMAFGLGFTESTGIGALNENVHPVFSSGNEKTRYDQTRYSLGLVLDPRIGQDRVFNHRFELSYQNMKACASTKKYTLQGAAIQNTFGFAVIQDQTTRFWVGPEVKVEFLEGKEISNGNRYHDKIPGFGFGPVIGVNYRVNDNVFLVAKGGYMQSVRDGVFF